MPIERILIDTNILVYLIDEDSIFFKKSHKLIKNPDYEFFTTSKNISEFLAVVTQEKTYSFNSGDIDDVLRYFENQFEILYPDPSSFELFKKLIVKYSPKGYKIHDYEIISIASANNVNIIATVNEKDFKNVNEIQTIALT